MHTAQGVTADTMHGVVTGVESRQQLYTMLTRGRTANHLYVSVVGDGDPHAVIQPDSLHPRTATELLEQILARDASPQSATTLQREQQDPAVRLGAATARYLDALHLAAEHLAGPRGGCKPRRERRPSAQRVDRASRRGRPCVATCCCWPPPAPIRSLNYSPPPRRGTRRAPVIRPPSSTRGSTTSTRSSAEGRCRGCPASPIASPTTPTGDHTCTPDHSLVAQLADQVRSNAEGEAPAWAAVRRALVPAELIADVQVWRAATQVDPSDLRPTGPPQLGNAARIFQQQLDKRLAAADTHADWQWRQLLATEVPSATADPFLPELEERLTNLTRAGFDATQLVRSAAAAGPLPDDHPAAALWWRILDQLPQTPNQEPATPEAVPATRRTTTTSHDKQRPLPRSAPPPAFGPSR